MFYQHLVDPIFRLNLGFSTQSKTEIRIDKTAEELIRDTFALFDRIVTSCNEFVRPEFAKVILMTTAEFEAQEEEEERARKRNFSSSRRSNEFENFMYRGAEKNLYSKYFGTLSTRVSPKPKKEVCFAYDEVQVFMKKVVDKTLKVADTDEEKLRNMKDRIATVIRERYKDTLETY